MGFLIGPVHRNSGRLKGVLSNLGFRTRAEKGVFQRPEKRRTQDAGAARLQLCRPITDQGSLTPSFLDLEDPTSAYGRNGGVSSVPFLLDFSVLGTQSPSPAAREASRLRMIAAAADLEGISALRRDRRQVASAESGKTDLQEEARPAAASARGKPSGIGFSDRQRERLGKSEWLTAGGVPVEQGQFRSETNGGGASAVGDWLKKQCQI